MIKDGRIYHELGMVPIILFPTLAACMRRNRNADRGFVVADDHLRSNYDGFAWCVDNTGPDHVIDSFTLDETVVLAPGAL